MEVNQLYRLAIAARMVKVAETTVRSAADRGELVVHTTACGYRLVTLDEIARWKHDGKRRRRGRPVSSGTAASDVTGR